MTSKQGAECLHQSVSYSSSPHASQAKYKQPTLKERQAATTPTPASKQPRPSSRIDTENFPAPLILPDDDLALDPEHPSQSFQEWLDEENRNPVTPRKRTIYVVPPPAVDKDIPMVQSWASPRKAQSQPETSHPEAQDVLDYVGAFYHGCPAKCLRVPNWSFCNWEEGAKSKGKATEFIGLNTRTECIRIRARPCPDKMYPYQLNLDDLLDAAISILPSDAYALCMLVNHDLYEDADDTFVCGRAYGGSRVAVVSTARYNPTLDTAQSVERQHAWPASHCKTYIEATCRASHAVSKKQKRSTPSSSSPTTKQQSKNAPLEAALAAFTGTLPRVEPSSPSPLPLSTLWLARMCRTVSHELGHCFGIDHCTYYACIMQGSTSLSEDARQPPYLCPVDLAKVLFSTGTTAKARYNALLAYCERPAIKELPHFAAFAAWLRASLAVCDVKDS